MGESRLIVEELLTLCLQRITMEESTKNAEQGETWCRTVVLWFIRGPQGQLLNSVLFFQR